MPQIIPTAPRNTRRTRRHVARLAEDARRAHLASRGIDHRDVPRDQLANLIRLHDLKLVHDVGDRLEVVPPAVFRERALRLVDAGEMAADEAASLVSFREGRLVETTAFLGGCDGPDEAA